MGKHPTHLAKSRRQLHECHRRGSALVVLDEEAVQEEEDLLSDGRIRFSQAFHDLVHVVLEGSLKGNGISKQH